MSKRNLKVNGNFQRGSSVIQTKKTANGSFILAGKLNMYLVFPKEERILAQKMQCVPKGL